MKIFYLHKLGEEVNVFVFDSIKDLYTTVKWQDLQNKEIIIIDENGNIYNWDKTKISKFASTYNYTLFCTSINVPLGKICKGAYVSSNFAMEFKMILE